MRNLLGAIALGAVLLSVGSHEAVAAPFQLTITDGSQTLTLADLSGDLTFQPGLGGGNYILNTPFALQVGTLSNANWNYQQSTSVSSNFGITNTTSSTQNFLVSVTVASDPLSAPTIMGGNIDLNISNPGTLTSVTPNAVYTAQFDGTTVKTLLNDPYSLSCTGVVCNPGSASFGPILGPAVRSSFTLVIQFALSPGAFVTANSLFNAPEPGTFALVGVGILTLVAVRKRSHHSA